MKSLNQEILKFDYEQNFQDQDFYVSKSNEFSFLLLNSWPKWEKNFINLIGEKFSGKSHLINIFLHKFKGIKINAADISNEYLKKIKIYENIIIEDLNKKMIFDNYLPHSSVMFKKEFLKKIGYFYPKKFKYAQDYALWLKLYGIVSL